MPKGPKGEKRPADLIGNVVRMLRARPKRIRGTAELGRKGGRHAKAMTAERRAEIARKAPVHGSYKKRAALHKISN